MQRVLPVVNPLLFALVVVAMIAFGLAAGCERRGIHRSASYDEWEEEHRDGLYRIEAYPCACKRTVPYLEKYKIATA